MHIIAPIRLALPLASVAALALSLPGCGSDETLQRDLEQLESHLDALAADVDAHATAALEAPDLDALQSAEPAHRSRIDEHMTGMQGQMDDMGRCTDGDGHQPDLGAMTTHMSEMSAECDGHDQAMEAAGDMGAARTEEQRHRAAMHDAIDRMRSIADGMMNDSGMMGDHSCGDDMHGMM